MARLKLDFRPLLRAIASRAQDENLERLLSGVTVNGASLAPRTEENAVKGRAKRVRLFGIRVSVRDLGAKLGVRTGAMLKDITRRSNIKLGRVAFHIVPSPEMRARWFAFVKGASREGSLHKPGHGLNVEPARPISGMSGSLIRDARDQVAAQAKGQFVTAVNQRRRD